MERLMNSIRQRFQIVSSTSDSEPTPTDDGDNVKIDEKSPLVNLTGKTVANDDAFEDILRQHTHPANVLTFVLTGNEALKRIPLTLARFDQLKKLDMSNNYISEIHWSIVYLKKLEVLNLAQNVIQAIPKTIGQLDSLQEFDVSHNPILCLPTELVFLPHLKKLNVTGCKYLLSPTLEECKDLSHILELLRNRQNRQNVWATDTAWYSEGSRLSMLPCGSVKSLQSCCMDVIVTYNIDFLHSMNVAPMIKSDLQEFESECTNRLDVSKCGRCGGYFSSVELFNAHTCRLQNNA